MVIDNLKCRKEEFKASASRFDAEAADIILFFEQPG
jgi:hypothetical protein